ncbi:hypothetical protein EYF80_019149 [Liparis tanakae]|uniref:Uncharacterized protein n=1 Tax=Liparis tanakae TaxID=230148 RepID=A0A4Z2HZ00_9TELE|nr:hypothetical protein EYF80_019149 [Liparis tanakae]
MTGRGGGLTLKPAEAALSPVSSAVPPLKRCSRPWANNPSPPCRHSQSNRVRPENRKSADSLRGPATEQDRCLFLLNPKLLDSIEGATTIVFLGTLGLVTGELMGDVSCLVVVLT